MDHGCLKNLLCDWLSWRSRKSTAWPLVDRPVVIAGTMLQLIDGDGWWTATNPIQIQCVCAVTVHHAVPPHVDAWWLQLFNQWIMRSWHSVLLNCPCCKSMDGWSWWIRQNHASRTPKQNGWLKLLTVHSLAATDFQLMWSEIPWLWISKTPLVPTTNY